MTDMSGVSARPRDTSPEAWEVYVRLLRGMTAEQKLRRVGELYDVARGLALSGLRQRYPNAGPEELRMRLLAMFLGEDLVRKVYGWQPTTSEQ